MGKHEKKSKKHKESKKKHKHKKKYKSSSSSSSTSEDEWVEKKIIDESKKEVLHKRDDWMSMETFVPTISQSDRKKTKEMNRLKEQESEKYNPGTSVRELNPYWKNNGDGLPTAKKTEFKKPNDDSKDMSKSSFRSRSSGWRKTSSDKYTEIFTSEDRTSSSNEIFDLSHTHSQKNEAVSLTSKEINELSAKIIKAEIMGNTTLAIELKEKLKCAQKSPDTFEEEAIILSNTDSKGYSKPLNPKRIEDPWGGKKGKKRKVETHNNQNRINYYPDDDKYTLHNMFENEKFGDSSKQDAEFIKLTSKFSKSDDMDDVFVDNIRKKESDDKINKREREEAISKHKKLTQYLDNCQQCLQSAAKHLIISFGETVYLALPPYEPLTDGHCIISPIRHVAGSTHLDENEWSEVIDFRKSLTKMFLSHNQDVVFFETVVNLHFYPHMMIHCIPMPKEQGDLAPIYFKKAIDECETEWAVNKKLVKLSGKDVRKAVPKGLPYFYVAFGMDEGFAHVIEEQKYFPKFFAQEIIGGMLDLHHSKWRKSRNQEFDVQKSRVEEFSKSWTNFDCTKRS